MRANPDRADLATRPLAAIKPNTPITATASVTDLLIKAAFTTGSVWLLSSCG
jgi:hypothetical protein